MLLRHKLKVNATVHIILIKAINEFKIAILKNIGN